MAITNRALDITEQRKVYSVNLPQSGSSYVVQTGYTAPIMVPFPCLLDAAQMYTGGVSGPLQVQLNVDRFIAGSGFTTIILAKGTSNLAISYGTSGVLGATMLLVAAGSTLLQLQAGDVLQVSTLGSAAAAVNAMVSVVLRPLIDVKTQFGV